MHYEIWDTETANLVGEYDTEAEGLAAVRRLIAGGWDPEHLGLGQEWDDDEGDDDDLAPPLYGAELVARVMTADPDRQRRSA